MTKAKHEATFSLDEILQLRSEGFARLRMHAAEVLSIGNAIEHLDASLQTFQADRGIDEMQQLVTSCRHLSSLLNGEPGDLIESSNVDFCAEARIARGMISAPELPTLEQMMGAA